MQCDVCGVNCHRRCKTAMPNLCGVNQKLLAEALLVIKSQKSAARGKICSTNVQETNKIKVSDKPNRSEMPLPEPPNQIETEAAVSTKVFILKDLKCYKCVIFDALRLLYTSRFMVHMLTIDSTFY